ncbi:hypothetical protein ETF18_04685 [Listeria monocytogenes]|nr:hypothetical protein [Listeria monocytogenes]
MKWLKKKISNLNKKVNPEEYVIEKEVVINTKLAEMIRLGSEFRLTPQMRHCEYAPGFIKQKLVKALLEEARKHIYFHDSTETNEGALIYRAEISVIEKQK